MSLLSGNLLASAQRLIPPVTVSYRAWVSNTKNAALVVVPAYADAVTLLANVQPVPKDKYELFGLDLQKNYVTVYASKALRDLQRNESCDTIDYGGRRYDVASNTDWFLQNGWRGALCVDTGPTP